MLEHRDASLYGNMSLPKINDSLKEIGDRRGYFCEFFQSNSEGELIDKIHQAILDSTCCGLMINPGAFAHTSIALRDALELMSKPVVEVHLSNIHSRESFRRQTYSGEVATGIISGFKAYGYIMGLDYLIHNHEQRGNKGE